MNRRLKKLLFGVNVLVFALTLFTRGTTKSIDRKPGNSGNATSTNLQLLNRLTSKAKPCIERYALAKSYNGSRRNWIKVDCINKQRQTELRNYQYKIVTERTTKLPKTTPQHRATKKKLIKCFRRYRKYLTMHGVVINFSPVEWRYIEQTIRSVTKLRKLDIIDQNYEWERTLRKILPANVTQAAWGNDTTEFWSTLRRGLHQCHTDVTTAWGKTQRIRMGNRAVLAGYVKNIIALTATDNSAYMEIFTITLSILTVLSIVCTCFLAVCTESKFCKVKEAKKRVGDNRGLYSRPISDSHYSLMDFTAPMGRARVHSIGPSGIVHTGTIINQIQTAHEV